MSYSQIGGVIGAAVGYYVGGPSGAQWGYAIGAGVGALATPKEKIQGPRLEDLKLTGSEYGSPIPWVQGHPRISGGVWWSSEKREIATTEEQGKGGGAEVTTYTYEVDVLIGLTDNQIVGIRRIWSNGKLVYSAADDATDDTLLASQQSAPWRSITVLTGAADQLPHPVYEADVGAENACAYRGRGAVMVEGLQLGGSGIMPNLTFEVVVDGEAQSGSAVLLQSRFVAANADDESPYDRGPPTQNGGVVGEGEYVINRNNLTSPLTPSFLEYEPSGFESNGSDALTFEAIVEFVQTPNISYTHVFGISYNTADAVAAHAFGYYADAGLICYDNAEFGLQYISPSPPATPTHLAIVFAASGTRAYIGGTKVWESLGSAIPVSAQMRVRIGDPFGYTSGVTHFKCLGFRVCQGEVYTGSSFTPPTSIPDPLGGDLISITETSLRTVVERLCGTIGLTSAEFDASDLSEITKPVRGLAVGQVSAARRTLEVLQAAFFFESSLSDKLRFRPRAVTPVDEIDYDDLAAGNEEASGEPLALVLASDVEMPSQFAVSYINKAADDQTATERSDRMLASQDSVAVVAMPLGMLPEEAKGIADAILVDTLASSSTTAIRVPLKYAELEPGDVVTVNDGAGGQVRVRLVRRTDALGVLAFDAVLDDADALTSAGLTAEDYVEQVTIDQLADTMMVLLDVPLLRDADDAPGWYVAARGTNANWPGATIRQSADDVTYSTAAEVAESAVLGTCMTTLGNFTGGHVFDEVNSLTVDVGPGQLSSATRTALLENRQLNVLQVGAEVIQFRTATMTAPGVYVVSGLLRGRAGTEWAISGHTSGETCVLLRPRGLRRVTTQFAEVGQLRYVKGVTHGRLEDAVDAQSFTNSGVSSKPFAPVDLRKVIVDGLVEATWKRRTRLSTKFMGTTGAVVPLGEPTERYQVDIYEPGGGPLLSTVIVTEPRIGSTGGTGSGGLASGTVVKTWSEGISFPYEYGGHLFGVLVEGDGSRVLVKMNAAGDVVDSSFVLGNEVQDVVYVGSTCYAIGHFLYSNGSYQLTRIYKFSLDSLSTLSAYYTPAAAGDAGGLAWDGTHLWSTGYFSGDLRKHLASDVTVAASYTIEPLMWGLEYAGAGQFIIAVANAADPKVISYEPGGAPVVWTANLPLYSAPSTLLLASGLVFLGAGVHVFALDASDGSILHAHAGGAPYHLPNTGAQGMTAFGGYVYYKTAAHLPFNRLTAATGALFDTGVALPVTTLTGVVAGNLFGVRSPTNSFRDYKGYEVALGPSGDPGDPGGALDGLRLVVRQIGANDVLGYPAEITL